MNYRLHFFLFLLLLPGISYAQKPFTEGTIIYKVKLKSADNTEISGVYTFIIKGNEIRKEIKLNNGYQDIVLLNCGNSKVYSLQNLNNKKCAIELNMAEMTKQQEKFIGFTVKNEHNDDNKNIAGYAVFKGKINYKDGSGSDIYYTKEWRPVQPITFERFPDAKFLPISFSYKDESGMVMEFEIEKIEPHPVENAVFRIPPDYKMISYAEYKQLSK
jgi:hypothetical protein